MREWRVTSTRDLRNNNGATLACGTVVERLRGITPTGYIRHAGNRLSAPEIAGLSLRMAMANITS